MAARHSFHLLPTSYFFMLLLTFQTTDGAVFIMNPSASNNIVENDDIILGTNEWSASFAIFHEMKILNNIPAEVQLFVICETDEPVINVRLKFKKATDHDQSREYVLNVNTLQENSFHWMFSDSRKVVISMVELYNINQGGRFKLSLEGQPWDGTFWCEIEQEKSVELIKSNDLHLVDIRSTIGSILGNRNFQAKIPTHLINGKGITLNPYSDELQGFFSSGMTTPSWHLSNLRLISGYRDIVSQSIAFGSPRKVTTFSRSVEMPPEKLGAYFIDKFGQIHININNEMSRMFSALFDNFTYPNFVGLSQDLSLGNSVNLYVLETYHRKNLIKHNGIPSFNLPKMVYPSKNEIDVVVTQEFSREYLECGFLANNPELSIVWLRNGQVVTSLKEFGLEMQPNKMSIDLFNANSDATANYTCQLQTKDVSLANMKASFNVKVMKLPSFGKSSRLPVAGKPPPLIMAMDGDSLEIKCIVDGYNGQNDEDRLVYNMIPIIDPMFAPIIKLNFTTRFELLSQSILWSKHARAMVYQVNDLQANIPIIQKSQSHLVKCFMKGSFQMMDYKTNSISSRIHKSEVYTKVVVNEKFTPENMEHMPIECSKRETGCLIGKIITFRCAMKRQIQQSFKNNLVDVQFYWKLGEFTQAIIESKTTTNVLKKYVRFFNDSVSILNVHSKEDILELNKLIPQVQCVFRLSYPSNTDKFWLADKVKFIDSSGTSLPSLGSGNLEFYSTEKDVTMNHLIAKNFHILDNAVVFYTNILIIVPISIAGIFILCIFCILAFVIFRNNGKTYGIDSRERKQGRNPEKELNENHFKEYCRPQSNSIKMHDRRFSFDSSLHVGSDLDDNDLDEYGRIEQGKFNEDGSFIGNYCIEQNKNVKSLP